MNNPEHFMSRALELADQAEKLDEVPVGAVVVCDGEIIGEGFNRPISDSDPTAHAEVQAMRQAAANVGNYRLANCDLYVTIEPCAMCAGAMVHARIRKLYFGAAEPRAGVVESNQLFFSSPWLNHRTEYASGILEQECREKIQKFFRARRES